jgi:hypothetical protein
MTSVVTFETVVEVRFLKNGIMFQEPPERSTFLPTFPSKWKLVLRVTQDAEAPSHHHNSDMKIVKMEKKV